MLVDGLLHADGTLRHRVIASLNKLSALHPDVRVEPEVIEVLLAAEIAGHYRSYQVLGPLRASLKEDDPVLEAMRHAMEQELERIFRLMALLLPADGPARCLCRRSARRIRSSAPTRSSSSTTCLKPELRPILVPLLDAQVTIEERMSLADRFVGAPLETPEQAIATLLESEDVWLRSCAHLRHWRAPAARIRDTALARFEASGDTVLARGVRSASRARLAGQRRGIQPQEPAPPDMSLGVGAG